VGSPGNIAYDINSCFPEFFHNLTPLTPFGIVASPPD